MRAGWHPTDVFANYEAYFIKSISSYQLKRHNEVKVRSAGDGFVKLSENEMNHLTQVGNEAWLYIVMNCKSSPELYRLQNPAKALNF